MTTLENLEIGERVKVIPPKSISHTHSKWIAGTIAHMHEKKVFVTFESWPYLIDMKYGWIEREKNKIKAFKQRIISYEAMENVSIRFKITKTIPPPIYFESSDNKSYFIASHPDCVRLYDIQENHYQTISSYPSNFDPSKHHKRVSSLRHHHRYKHYCHALDKKNQILYIMRKYDCTLAIFSIEDKTWDVVKPPLNYWTYFCGFNDNLSIIYIPHPINELHIVVKQEHFKYDDVLQQFVHLSKIRCGSDPLSRLIYVDTMKKLFYWNGSGDIWHCSVDIMAPERYIWCKWKWFPNDQPVAFRTNHIIVIQQVIIVLRDQFVHSRCADMFCIDLLHKKCSVSNYNLPNIYKPEGCIMQCSKNMIRFYDYLSKKHYRWSLNDVVPSDIEDIYRQSSSDLLISGFIKKEEQKYHLNVPYYLKKLVLAYYPNCFNQYT